MPRYVLDIRYKGTAYSGWQTQPNAVTVQAEVQRALTLLCRQPTTCYGAGRTDAGVHALLMPAHFDFAQALHPRFLSAINGILPRDISVLAVHRALDPQYHARFSAVQRAYRYQLIFHKDPMRYQMATWIKEKLDFDAMFAAAGVILEYDSFESFCKANANNKTFICQMFASHFAWEGEVLVYHVRANRFLRGMVRTLVGTLVDVGLGRNDLAGVRRIIEAQDRKQAGPSLAPGGLYLSEVVYPAGMFERVL
ncbi:MAG: tRNA pseudouridine(38-40) synthase TruA [Bacteroidota bacterium]